MQDQWYGDKRDLVKWGVLLQLAEKYGAKKIIQAAYYRPNTWDSLEIDGKNYPIHSEVIKHFRDVRNILRLSSRFQIEVMNTPFQDREKYTQDILRTIAGCGPNKCIVFLDPDTGLEPNGSAGFQHVLESELHVIWNGMRVDDVLVFYQHETNKGGKPWIEQKRAQFAKALGLKIVKVKKASGIKIARDVVFFFCQKAA